MRHREIDHLTESANFLAAYEGGGRGRTLAIRRLLRRAPHSAVGMVGRRAFNAVASAGDTERRGLMPRWRVDFLGKELQRLGTVEAPDEKSSLQPSSY